MSLEPRPSLPQVAVRQDTEGNGADYQNRPPRPLATTAGMAPVIEGKLGEHNGPVPHLPCKPLARTSRDFLAFRRRAGLGG
jgi:hypothetical protein